MKMLKPRRAGQRSVSGDQSGRRSKLMARGSGKWLALLRYNGVLVLTIIAIVVLSIGVPQFASTSNFANILQESSLVGIVAMGMAMLLMSGNFDLSVPGTVQLGGIFLAFVSNRTNPLISIVALMFFGLLIGLMNGVIVTLLHVNSLIATLGTGFVLTGMALVVTDGSPIRINDSIFTNVVNASVLGIPFAGIVWIVIALFATWLLHFTVLGRQIRAVGSNEAAARIAGVQVLIVRLTPFVLTGLFSAIAAAITAGLVDAGDPNVGATWALEAIAAAVVGGVAITGGVGVVPMAVVGVLLINVLRNAFVLTGLNSNYEQVLIGGLLIAAVAFDVAVRSGTRSVQRAPKSNQEEKSDE